MKPAGVFPAVLTLWATSRERRNPVKPLCEGQHLEQSSAALGQNQPRSREARSVWFGFSILNWGSTFATDTQEQNLAHPPSPHKGAGAALALPKRQCRTALKLGFEAQLASPANTFTPNDPQAFSASPEIPPGTSGVSCWLVPTPRANPARRHLGLCWKTQQQ